MIQDKDKIFLELYQVVDFLVLGLAFVLAYFTKIAVLPDIVRGLAANQNYTLVFLLTSISCQFNLRFAKTYPPYAHIQFRHLFSQIVKAISFGILFAITLLYITHIADISRLLMGLFSLYAIVLLSAVKGCIFYILNKKHSRSYHVHNILIIGARDRSLDIIDAIIKNGGSGYHLIGCLETVEYQERIGEEIYESVKIIGTLDIFNKILLEESVDEIIFALPLRNIKKIHNYIYFAEEIGIKVRVMPDFQIQKIKFYPRRATVFIDYFFGLPTLAVSSTSANELGLLVKNFIDYTGAAVGMVVLAPVFLIIAILIKATSTGPVFFDQERCGLNGRRFLVRKFRTMYECAEDERKMLEKDNEMDGPVFKMKNDPRITSVGYFLRKTSLDELPQLINVLRGEMSLVGPRPPIPEEVERYQLWQRRRLSMKPGITCIWQVSGRNNTSFEEWMNMDLEYIDNWSPFLDLKLLFLTIKEVIKCSGR